MQPDPNTTISPPPEPPLTDSPTHRNHGSSPSSTSSSISSAGTADLVGNFNSQAAVNVVNTSALQSAPKTPARRISEYENAFSPSPQRTDYEGPIFKVVKKKNSRPDAPQLEEFPNGETFHT